jgi:hypothetical protein
MTSQYRQPRVFQGHPQPANLLPFATLRQRIQELRRERALVEKAIAALTEVSRSRDRRRRQAAKN